MPEFASGFRLIQKGAVHFPLITAAADISQDGTTDTPKEQGVNEETRIQDLAAAEIRDLLLQEGSELDKQ